MTTFAIKRVYDKPSTGDGYRVFVDRIMPKKVKREHIKYDEWNREVEPASDMRIWFGHETRKYHAFYDHYIAELEKSEEAREFKKAMQKHKVVTILFTAKDLDYNFASVLREFLSRR